ncbi:hypothetical protein WA1_43165 [Scytonema hofmannii PCC 7110]|uniref:Peptidase S8/S53 domain-containing protein n=1 Tax=Scytonema hofmannii PCC 7110 TaxID=128403 RepID=A0A139WVP0_9CYAN|nr:S8 family serine peptidase [Scytonema hofmannii]KYC36497.1 hypothetical protein WA1_43165 [Scytonema hofmannii PCC 7110]
MTIYIIQPRSNPASSLDLISTKFTAPCRQKQVREVINLWQEDVTYQKLQNWLLDAQKEGTVRAVSNLSNPGITGTVIADLSDEAVIQIQEDLPDIAILKDEPIELIQPNRNIASLKDKVTETDLWHLAAIGLTKARQKGCDFTGKGITVAVLDTGIDGRHPELSRKIISSYNLDAKQFEIFGDAELLDQDEDTEGHGTHVAGLICGNEVGIAPEVGIINGIMLPQGIGSLFSFVVGMRWISTRSDVDIVNISAGELRGGLELLDLYAETLLAVGILPVCAVGNEGRNRTRSPGNCRSVISVGATTQSGKVAPFSSSGTIVLDHHQYTVPLLVAPGSAVYSSTVGGHYEAWDGTSMATPIVSGIAALILQEYPNITVMELTEALLERCTPLPGQLAERQGAGIIKVEPPAR